MQETYKALINYFGTQHNTAKALKVSQPTVYKWSSGKSSMTAGTAINVERVTKGKFKANQLSPELEGVEIKIIN